MASGLSIAKMYLGMQEIRDNTRLIEFFKKNNVTCNPAETPWCSAFINACERQAGKRGTGSLAARSFLKYGKGLDEDDAEEGDIIIFKRGNSPFEGHVAYFIEWADDENCVKVLGGNQSDRVCYNLHSQDGILGVRRST